MFAVFKVFHLEHWAFQQIIVLAVLGLPIHYLLPYRWKKPMFVGLSVAAIAWIFGAVVASIVLTAAAALIGVCYLPVSWKARAGLMAGLTVAFATIHSGTVSTPIPSSVWTVLGTMFMFRMVIYLYELKHAKKPETLIDTVSYFFLLPNYCFLHFPVVDYRTLQRGYFAKDIHATQRAGLQMMFRGTTHLLLYRLVYHELLIKPADVSGPLSLVGYLLCNYLLYLQVSGQFHMACGMLHLFGYQLPETHRHYLMASSFTDYWRRINIYWKDFMVRVVFNPIVFRLKRWPQPAALAVATAVVFVVTWALHDYQWFWLQGSWKFRLPDALFWGILGLLVLVNVQFDARRSNARRPKANANTPRQLALHGLKTAGTFATLTLLWSLWYSPSVSAWVDMLRRGLGGS